MSTQAERPAGGDDQARGRPDEDELRAAYEAELGRIASIDMVLQAAASLLNIGAYRLGLTRDGEIPSAGADRQAELEQVRDAIDAVRGLLPVIERRAAAELRPLRDALSQLQMAYTRAVQTVSAQPQDAAAGEEAPGAERAGEAGGTAGGQTGQQKPAPGPAESSGRLWVPGR